MEGTKNLINHLSFRKPYIYFVIIYGVGIIGHFFQATLPLMIILTPFVLVGSTATVLYFSIRDDGYRALAWIGATGAVTFLLEVIGVKTGMVFGHYRYEDVLGVKVMEVPMVIALNWIVILFGANILAQVITTKRLLRLALAAAMALAVDLVMEPVAVSLGYWTWLDGSIPVQNYIAWICISGALSGAYILGGVTSRNRVAPFFLVILAVYFGILNLA